MTDCSEKFEFDMLQMFYGEPYKVKDGIIIHQPTIGEIMEFGERRMFSSIRAFTGNTNTYRLELWNMGIDWTKITDYELFLTLVRGLKPTDTCLIFGDLDFTAFEPCKSPDTGEIILADVQRQIEIDESTYLHIASYLRVMFNHHPDTKKVKGRTAKEMVIEQDKQALEEALQSPNKSTLLPLISAMVNHPGFKYKKNELKEVGIVEFMDSVQRLQIYESTKSLMGGMYSGMLDTSKIDMNKELNWLRDMYS